MQSGVVARAIRQQAWPLPLPKSDSASSQISRKQPGFVPWALVQHGGVPWRSDSLCFPVSMILGIWCSSSPLKACANSAIANPLGLHHAFQQPPFFITFYLKRHGMVAPTGPWLVFLFNGSFHWHAELLDHRYQVFFYSCWDPHSIHPCLHAPIHAEVLGVRRVSLRVNI